MKKILTITLIGFVLFLSSCKKDETTDSTTTPSTSELITASAWKVSNYSSTATDAETKAILKEWNDAIKLNPLSVSYRTNGTYLYSDSSEFGTWELSGNKSIIFEKGTPDELLSTIDNITTSNFVITYSWQLNDSLEVKITETCVK